LVSAYNFPNLEIIILLNQSNYSNAFRYNRAMTTPIKDLLDKYKYAEPPEIQIIKDYLREHFQAEATITVQPRTIIISVSSAALAGALRSQLHQLQELCGNDKRLVIRIQ
jgi:hypothetical protein